MTPLYKKILFTILILGFAVRVAGVGYGLPLWLVADEPPFVLAALKMIELKTIIPGLHAEEFKSFLYYPPYLSYILIPILGIILGFKYFSFEGSLADFTNYLGADLSYFFVGARLLSVALAVLSIYLVYRTAKNIFKEEWPALLSSFFIATSSLHIILSMTSRQWLAISLIHLSVIYFLTEPALSFKKRYFLSVLVAGVGMGISVISSLSVILIILYCLFFEEKKIFELLREKFVYLLAFMFIALAFLPLILYPSSLGFGRDVTASESKLVLQFILAPFAFLARILFAEPFLVLSSAVGLVFAFFYQRKIFWPFLIFILAYSYIFNFAFRFEDRFLSPLLPLICILAGFGLWKFFNYLYRFEKLIAAAIVAVFIILPSIFSLRLGYLAYAGDSRENMRAWIEEGLPPDAKIIVSARLLRVSSNKEALLEQEKIDKNSLRQVERSEIYFGKNPIYPSFHALNLNSIENPDFFADIEKYIADNSYEYMVLAETDYRKNPELHERFKKIAEEGEFIVSFGEDSPVSISESFLGGSPFLLLETKELGPKVSLYNLPAAGRAR